MMLNGVKRGVELVAVFVRAYARASDRENAAALVALTRIAKVWFTELTGVGVDAKTWNVRVGIMALTFGSDPFQGSRAMLRALLDEWPELR